MESWVYQACCTECGLVTVAEHPAGLESTRTFGPGTETAIAYLHERHHVSFERLVELCRDLFGIQLSEGAVANVLQRLGERGETRYQEIREAVRASPVIGSDETGARVAGRTWWHWNFQTPTASYHVIARTRSGSVINDFLDGAVPDVWQSDAYAPQLRAPAKAGQLCLAHQLRELTRAAELEPTRRGGRRSCGTCSGAGCGCTLSVARSVRRASNDGGSGLSTPRSG
ncbi:MAG: transposase [Chloroflexota bacterium]